MPKIRGVKPELWTDESFVELSAYARLLWIGLWNHACDNGHLQDKSKQIKMRVLPTDDINCAELLREIEKQGLISRSDGWITIPNLSEHQKPHKHWYVICDMPGCVHPPGMTYGFGGSACSKPDCRHKSTVDQPLTNGGAPVDQPVINGGSTADGDVDGDVDGELKVKLAPAPPSRELAAIAAETSQTLVAEWIDHCAEKPPSRVIGHIAKEVKTLLDDGIDYGRVRAGLAEWNTRDVHPSVLPSIVHGLANRKPRASTRRAEDEAMFERQMQRAIAREAGQQ